MRSVAWLDLNADRARCWLRTADAPSKALPLEPHQEELRLALRAEGRRLVLGQASWEQHRLAPHLTEVAFLPRLGEDAPLHLGRQRVAIADAVKLLFQQVKERLGSHRRLLLTLPSWFTTEQARRVQKITQDLGLESLGTMPRELLFGLESSTGESAWKAEGLLLDVDEHALVATVLRPTPTDLRQVKLASRPSLGRKVWRERLLAVVAARCVATERRDPLALPEAEQALCNQSDEWFKLLGEGRDATADCFLSHRALPAKVALPAAVAARACDDLLTQTADLATALHQGMLRPEGGGGLFFTPAAAELPGLVARLYSVTAHRLPITVLGQNLVGTGLALAESVAEKERLPVDYAARAVAFPMADFVFDAPAVLTFPGEGLARAAGNRG